MQQDPFCLHIGYVVRRFPVIRRKAVLLAEKRDEIIETHKEIPSLFCNPVHLRSGIFHVFGMTAHIGAKLYRILFGKTFKFCGDMGWRGGYRYFRQLCQSIVVDVLEIVGMGVLDDDLVSVHTYFFKMERESTAC